MSRGERASKIRLRPAVDLDEPFCVDLFASSRAAELAFLPLTIEQKRAFVRQQFAAQAAGYRQAFPAADYSVVLLDDQPIGRVIVAREPERMRLVDIALLPAHRGRGIGTQILQDILVESDRRQLPVCLHVEASNPARRLYERLGFRKIGEAGPYSEYFRPAAVNET